MSAIFLLAFKFVVGRNSFRKSKSLQPLNGVLVAAAIMLPLVRRRLGLSPPRLLRAICSRAGSTRIGDTTVALRAAERIELVGSANRSLLPSGSDSEETLATLEWLAKKALLRQDAMLLGESVGTLRSLAFRFCEVTGREAEHVSISRDTTESDLKQRREIRGGSVVYSDLPVVQAAVNGRVLIIEGLEKARARPRLRLHLGCTSGCTSAAPL